MNKFDTRKKFKSIRNNIPEEIRDQKSMQIVKKVLKMDAVDKASVIMIYNSFGSEVQTQELKNLLYIRKKTLLVPECDIDSLTMKAVVYNPESETINNIYGIEEQNGSCKYKGEIDVIIMPGIAFDCFGSRIGFGKGYYDKFIASLLNKPYLTGICFDEQITDSKIDCENFDIRLDAVISDKREIYTSERVL